MNAFSLFLLPFLLFFFLLIFLLKNNIYLFSPSVLIRLHLDGGQWHAPHDFLLRGAGTQLFNLC